MSKPIFLLLSFFAVIFLSNCKKEEPKKGGDTDKYPAAVVFSSPKAETELVGMIKFDNGTFNIVSIFKDDSHSEEIGFINSLNVNGRVDVSTSIRQSYLLAQNRWGLSDVKSDAVAVDGKKYLLASKIHSGDTGDYLYISLVVDIGPLTSTNLQVKKFLLSKITSLADGALIVGSYADNFDTSVYAVKIDFNYKKQWEKKLHASAAAKGIDAIELCDGTIAVIANIRKGSAGNDMAIIKINPQGDVINNTLTTNAIAYKIIKANNCGFYIAGQSNNYGYLQFVDANFNKIWEKTYSSLSAQGFSAISKLNNQGVIVAGTDKTINKAFVGAIGADGALQWEKKYDTDSLGIITPVSIIADGTFYYMICNGQVIKATSTGLFIKDKLN
jgi:hypothetical protein